MAKKRRTPEVSHRTHGLVCAPRRSICIDFKWVRNAYYPQRKINTLCGFTVEPLDYYRQFFAEEKNCLLRMSENSQCACTTLCVTLVLTFVAGGLSTFEHTR